MESPRSVLQNIGRRFIEIRMARGWTQETCAEKLWVDVRLLRRIEGGSHNLTVSTLVRLAQRLEVPTSALFEPSRLEAPRLPGRRRVTEAARAVASPAARARAPASSRATSRAKPPYTRPSATAPHALGEKARRRAPARAPRRPRSTKK